MNSLFQPYMDALSPTTSLVAGLILLLIATQMVVVVLNKLESRRFSSVYLGTLVTPLCTGFPNIMIGLFGQERLQGDLVIQLNIGNNIANTSLVTGLLLIIGGALQIRPKKGRSKAAKEANRLFFFALAFMWVGILVLIWTARDGFVDRVDALGLIVVYAGYHILNFRRRRKPTKKTRLPASLITLIAFILGLSALAIHVSLELIGSGMDGMGSRLFGPHLGLLLGLLTVFPESFLMLRLAIQKGNVGFSGLVGDCLVSIPFVIGLSGLIRPIPTTPFVNLGDAAFWPYIHLMITAAMFCGLAIKPNIASRKTGLLFLVLYVMVWLNSGA